MSTGPAMGPAFFGTLQIPVIPVVGAATLAKLMQFRLKVYSESAGVLDWRIDAASAAEASRKADERGYLVLSVSGAGWKGVFPAAISLRRRERFALLLFSQQLLALLEAGLVLVEAIEALSENEPDAQARAVMRQLLDQLYSGRTFSDAMAMQPEHFPPFYIAALRASERSGGMTESLRRHIAYQGQIETVRKKVVSAMIYPAVLLAVGALVTLFLLGYVVPRFSHIYAERSTDLPFLSLALMRWGKLVGAHGGKLLFAFALAVPAAAWLATREPVRRWLGARLWALPLIGERMRVYQLARLYRTLGMLLGGGTPIMGALGLVPGLLSPLLRPRLESAVLAIREGQSISIAMHAAGLTTPVGHRMLQVGERTGQMGEMMERVAAFYDDEVSRWVDVFTKVFEPALMALIGVMVGGIVILMYLPIFELVGTIQS